MLKRLVVRGKQVLCLCFVSKKETKCSQAQTYRSKDEVKRRGFLRKIGACIRFGPCQLSGLGHLFQHDTFQSIGKDLLNDDQSWRQNVQVRVVIHTDNHPECEKNGISKIPLISNFLTS